MNVSIVPGGDVRFGMQAPTIKSLTIKRPSDVLTQIGETRSGNLFAAQTNQITINGRTYTVEYSPSPRQLQFTPPSGSTRRVTTTVDTAGRPLETTLPGLATITNEYDDHGRIETITVGSRVWEYFYEDGTERLTRVVDPLGRETQFTYYDSGRLETQVRPDLSEILYAYDANGSLTTLQTPAEPIHRFKYRPGDLTRAYDPPDVSGVSPDTTHYSYNNDRQLTAIDRPDGISVGLNYLSTTGRLEEVTQSGGLGDLELGYSATGHLESIERTAPDANTVSFDYDGSLPTEESWDFGGVTPSVELSYDANLWPEVQVVHGAGGSADSASFNYDADGLLTSVATGRGTLTLTRVATHGLLDSTRLGVVHTQQGYNAYGELASLSADTLGTALFSSSYARDSIGRISRLTETVLGTTTDRGYFYDDLGRLIAVRDSAGNSDLARYGYDANGNRTLAATPGDTLSGSYDAQDRLTSLGSASYAYTNNGERLRKVVGTDTTKYTYDGLGNLLTVRLPGGTRVDYVIDGRGRRVGRKLNGLFTQRWVYQDGLNIVAELDSAGTVKSRFVYGGSGHVPDLMIHGDSTYRLITDHLGSVRLVVNKTTGYVAQRLAYDAWGAATTDTKPGFQPFGFAGGIYDPTTGLVRFGARDYDPATGVWTAKDPLHFEAHQSSLYTYVDNSPLAAIDPAGLSLGGSPTPAPLGIQVGGYVLFAFAVHDAVPVEARTLGLAGAALGAYEHAQATRLIACTYGDAAAVIAAIGQELWGIERTKLIAWKSRQFPSIAAWANDTVTDLKNDMQGLQGRDVYTMYLNGELYETPTSHVWPH